MLAAGLKVIVVAISLGLDVFAVGVGVGVRGVAPGVKLRIGIAFAFAEVAMNCIGAALGIVAGRVLGDFAGYLGFFALVGVGLYMIREALREAAERRPIDMSSGWGLAVASLSISLDSLGVGFSILYIGAPLPISLAVIGLVSVASTISGLSLGRSLGKHVEGRAELLGGVLLTLTGIAFVVMKALRIG
jgi:manganese efflux pump family protein